MKTTCFQCRKKLAKITAGPRYGELAFVTRNYHGTEVVMHHNCAATFDSEKPVTAQIKDTSQMHLRNR